MILSAHTECSVYMLNYTVGSDFLCFVVFVSLFSFFLEKHHHDADATMCWMDDLHSFHQCVHDGVLGSCHCVIRLQ